MADLIRANIGGIHSIHAALSEQLGALRDEEKKLDEAVRRLSPMWEGEAHDAFQADMTKCCQNIAAVDQKIAQVLGLEETAVDEYGRAQTEVDVKIDSI